MKQIAGRLIAPIIIAGMLAGSVFSAEKSQAGKVRNPFDLPMQFVLVRSNAGYCEPNCPEWIYGEGQIVAGTPAAFRKALKRMGDRKLPLLILSPGGNVEAAIELGRLVRRNKMAVEVGYTRFYDCLPRDKNCVGDGAAKGEFRGMAMVSGAFCWSACPLVLAGGERRLSSQWSNTGVHQVTTVYQRERVFYREQFKMVDGKKKVIGREIVSRKKAGTKSSTRLPKATRKLLTAYLKEMGVDKVLIDAMLSTPPDKIRKLAPVEMLNMRLITELSTTDLLTSPMLCTDAGSPDNCILRERQLPRRVAAQGPPAPN